MFLIDFVASEPVQGQVELDLDGVDTNEEAREFAEKDIKRNFPTYEDIQIIGIKEIE